MKNELKKITDLTVNELLNKDVILPSLYFEKFDKNAKELEVNLDDKEFQREINKLIVEDYSIIEDYMKSIMLNASSISDASKNAKDALLNKDVNMLNSIYKQMLSLEKEVKNLNNKLFQDDITNTFNRKWVYNKFLNKQSKFKNDGICILLDVVDYSYLKKEYGELLANNLLIFATNFIKRNLKEEQFDFKLVRFFDNKFLIFILNQDEQSVNTSLLNIQQMLFNTTLKSNSGLFIKANYKFKSTIFNSSDDSKDIFEKLFIQLKEE